MSIPLSAITAKNPPFKYEVFLWNPRTCGGHFSWKIASYHSPSTCIDRIDLYNISHLSIYLPIHPAISPSSYLSIQLSIHIYYPASNLSTYLSIHPSMCLLFPVPHHHFFSIYIYLFMQISICPALCSFISLPVCGSWQVKFHICLLKCVLGMAIVCLIIIFSISIIGFSPKPRRSGLPTRSEQSETNGKVYVMKLVS